MHYALSKGCFLCHALSARVRCTCWFRNLKKQCLSSKLTHFALMSWRTSLEFQPAKAWPAYLSHTQKGAEIWAERYIAEQTQTPTTGSKSNSIQFSSHFRHSVVFEAVSSFLLVPLNAKQIRRERQSLDTVRTARRGRPPTVNPASRVSVRRRRVLSVTSSYFQAAFPSHRIACRTNGLTFGGTVCKYVCS